MQYLVKHGFFILSYRLDYKAISNLPSIIDIIGYKEKETGKNYCWFIKMLSNFVVDVEIYNYFVVECRKMLKYCRFYI